MKSYILGYDDVALSLLLMAIAILLSRLRSLKLERNLAIGTVRSFAQLTLIGFALKFLFAHQSLLTFGAIATIMLLVASYEGVRRQTVRLPGFFFIILISLSAALVLSLAVVV
ncbi:MAG: ABC transporter permease, partial [Candidatus Marinimicrobia bacterium]|nr:ABC transporter permease [Candidatus Neomarinimicrobiota bacterium]